MSSLSPEMKRVTKQVLNVIGWPRAGERTLGFDVDRGGWHWIEQEERFRSIDWKNARVYITQQLLRHVGIKKLHWWMSDCLSKPLCDSLRVYVSLCNFSTVVMDGNKNVLVIFDSFDITQNLIAALYFVYYGSGADKVF